MKKVISKDWWKHGRKYKPENPLKTALMIPEGISRVDEIPQLLTPGDAAKALNISVTTVNRMFYRGDIGSIKIAGRRFTTPGYIAFYLENQARKNA